MTEPLKLENHQYAPALAVAKHVHFPATVPGGVLVYYEVGTGKTLAALHAARTFLDLKQGGNVYIVTTRTNVDATWERDWDTYKKAMNAGSAGASRPYTNSIKWGTQNEILEKKSLVEPYMMIIDEAHLIRNMEAKGLQNAVRACSSAAYVMLLTATPIVRTVDNINALYSCMIGSKESIVSDEVGPVELGKKLKQMVLYEKQDTSKFPKVTESVHNVELGEGYGAFGDAESFNTFLGSINKMKIGREQWRTTFKRIVSLGKESSIPNPFHVNSRRICNSEKFPQIWNAIVEDGQDRVVVYSNFRAEGVDGFMDWLHGEKKKSRQMSKTRKYPYLIWTDKQDAQNEKTYEVVLWAAVEKAKNEVKMAEMKGEIIKWQQDEDTICKILLISPMAREGLSLKGVRRFHIMEPSWNISDETQAVGRAVRMTSHAHLDKEEQTVHVRRWIGTFGDTETADQRLTDLARLRADAIKPYLGRLEYIGNEYKGSLLDRLSNN